MKPKPADRVYCGVRRKKIEAAEPGLNKTNMLHLYDFITERYAIHVKKDVYHLDPPWTDDDVLGNFRFTNVRREHDKETKWLIEHITSNRALSYEDKLLNIILFRIFNKHETAELLNMPIPFSKRPKWNPERYRIRFSDALLIDKHRIFFTGAFITGGTKRALKWYLPAKKPERSMEMRVMYFIKYLIDNDFVSQIIEAQKKDQAEVFSVLSGVMGIGEFLGYQIFVDMTYIKEFPFSENEFVVAGPGCKRGLKYIMPDPDGMTPEECLFWLRDNIDWLFQDFLQKPWNPHYMFVDLPEYDRYMNVMSLENCMCELSKYIRAKKGTGRPRKKYTAGGTR